MPPPGSAGWAACPPPGSGWVGRCAPPGGCSRGATTPHGGQIKCAGVGAEISGHLVSWNLARAACPERCAPGPRCGASVRCGRDHGWDRGGRGPERATRGRSRVRPRPADPLWRAGPLQSRILADGQPGGVGDQEVDEAVVRPCCLTRASPATRDHPPSLQTVLGVRRSHRRGADRRRADLPAACRELGGGAPPAVGT